LHLHVGHPRSPLATVLLCAARTFLDVVAHAAAVQSSHMALEVGFEPTELLLQRQATLPICPL
jgi:hypothetical protein